MSRQAHTNGLERSRGCMRVQSKCSGAAPSCTRRDSAQVSRGAAVVSQDGAPAVVGALQSTCLCTHCACTMRGKPPAFKLRRCQGSGSLSKSVSPGGKVRGAQGREADEPCLQPRKGACRPGPAKPPRQDTAPPAQKHSGQWAQGLLVGPPGRLAAPGRRVARAGGKRGPKGGVIAPKITPGKEGPSILAGHPSLVVQLATISKRRRLQGSTGAAGDSGLAACRGAVPPRINTPGTAVRPQTRRPDGAPAPPFVAAPRRRANFAGRRQTLRPAGTGQRRAAPRARSCRARGPLSLPWAYVRHPLPDEEVPADLIPQVEVGV